MRFSRERAEKLLEMPAGVDRNREDALTLELAEKTIAKDSFEGTEDVFLAGLYQVENGIRGAHPVASRPGLKSMP